MLMARDICNISERGTVTMLTREELEKSPLFQGISYESYCAMLHCFQAVQKSLR